jgi:hypothetical protein
MIGTMSDEKPVRRGPMMPKPELDKVQNEASLGRDIQSKIGEQLRAMYDDVVSQGVPDRFADLLRRLDQKGDGDRQ